MHTSRTHQLRLLITLLTLTTLFSFADTLLPRATVRRTGAATLFATITVNTTADENGTGGACSLREAIVAANTNAAFGGCTAGTAGADTINFAIGGAGPHTIAVSGSGLPVIVEQLTINGYSQAGSVANTLPSATNATIQIVLNGAGTAAGTHGLNIQASNSRVEGLVIQQFPGDGIHIENANNVEMFGNFIGTNVTGTAAAGNGGNGIAIVNGDTNEVGDRFTGVSTRNLISGNGGHGILISGSGSTGNIVEVNLIGTNAAGTADLGNTGDGIHINGATGTAIGGSVGTTPGGACTGSCNLISGNGDLTAMPAILSDGIQITGDVTSANFVQGNIIGLDVTGTVAIGNSGEGVLLDRASNQQIGGTTATARNIISGNGGDGVEVDNASSGATSPNNNVISGNFIGTDTTGTLDRGNGSNGVAVLAGSGNKIGGTTGTTPLGACTGACNVLSGNSFDGISIAFSSSGTIVEGNFIGTNAAGTAAIANTFEGININGPSSNNIIGGTTAAARNIISGNGSDGIEIQGSTATGNVIQGNFIGTDTTGEADLGNTDDGVFISGAPNNTVGGTTATTPGGACTGACNVISGNNNNGVQIRFSGATGNQIRGNFIGTDKDGVTDLGNTDDGVFINDVPGNTVGGSTAAARNVISGNNSDGVAIEGTGAITNTVSGNFIGTDTTGELDLGNSADGVDINSGAQNNIIGGTTGTTPGGGCTGACNLLSGNEDNGVIINGATSSGNTVLGNFIGTDDDGVQDLGNDEDGVLIQGGPSNTVGGTTANARNVISGNGNNIFDNSNGVRITFSSAISNFIQGNFIGVGTDGATALGNIMDGVVIEGSATLNQIGGTTGTTLGGNCTGACNVISNNGFGGGSGSFGDGVQLNSNSNIVLGNFIGTDVTGLLDRGNEFHGVFINNAASNTVGGLVAGARNVISGNTFYGVFIQGASATNNAVLGNFIGTTTTGLADLGNSGRGVEIASAPGNTVGGTTGTTPGGACTGACNVISGNDLIGVNIIGASATANQVLGNSIFNNSLLGIDLAGNGVTANDLGDPDLGPNNLQNYPVLSCAQSGGGTTTVAGSLNSLPLTSFRIEFFANTVCDPSGNGEGQTFLGFQNVTTDASGNATFTAPLAVTVAVGQIITATATRLDAMGNPVETSEFSACQTVVASPTVTINDVTVTEGNIGTTNAVFTITVTGALNACLPITVNFATQDGTAMGPGDFTPTAGSITFNPPFASDTLTQQITIPVVGDFTFEPDETFFVNIAAVNAVVTDAQGQGTILNDDPPLGPGLTFPEEAEVSDQKAGSVLVYNLYSSNAASPNSQNTRIAITNVHPTALIAVHLFFVDGATCSIADAIICLTKNQTAAFLASDIDPGTTGYLVAIASDPTTGCPINFNFLIGDEYVKLSSGHAANLGAEAFSALPGGPVACDGNSVTAQLNFNGVSYNRVPRTLAASSIPARADGNDTLLVVNRFGGNLAIGAATLFNLFGILYDDAENALSFTFSPGACQFRSSLSNNFPRTTPRLENFIPAGRSGWLRLFSTSDIGLLGAILNFNPNAAASAGAFNQGRNLHKLTLTATQTLVIPIFPPNCLD